MTTHPKKLITIGCSFGGVAVLKRLFIALQESKIVLPPIVVVIHQPKHPNPGWMGFFQDLNSRVEAAYAGAFLAEGKIFLAPPGYHLVVEPKGWLSLDSGSYVRYSRPSIDVLFESAAFSYGKNAIGILCTGGNSDGAKGLQEMHDKGGITVVQDPEDCEAPYMPQAALRLFKPSYVATVSGIVRYITAILDASPGGSGLGPNDSIK